MLGSNVGQLIKCPLSVATRFNMPYIKNVESRDSEAGEAGRPKGNPPIVATYSHSWKRSSASGLIDQMKHLYKPFFLPPFKMINYDQKQSKEIYDALLDSKVDLLEYFLGPDPKKSSYYRKHVKRYRVQSILNDY